MKRDKYDRRKRASFLQDERAYGAGAGSGFAAVAEDPVRKMSLPSTAQFGAYIASLPTICRVEAKSAYNSQGPTELSFSAGGSFLLVFFFF
jgi:hypothetical protein